MSEVIVTQKEIENTQQSLEKTINGYTHKIGNKLRQYGELYSDPSFERSIDAVYQGFAVIDILWNKLVKGKRLQKEVGMILAAYVGADYGLEYLGVRHDTRVFRYPEQYACIIDLLPVIISGKRDNFL